MHATTSLIQKLKLMGRSEQFTYTSTIMLIFITSQFDRIKMMMIGSRGISSVEEQCHLQTYFSTQVVSNHSFFFEECSHALSMNTG